MSDYVCFLIWVLYEGETLECALKVHKSMLPAEADSYPMEYRDAIHELLPLHVKSCGPIIKVETIFEVHEVTK